MIERDAHLREALRHAPDAQVQPPSAVSSFILNEARAKARDASPPPRPKPNALATLWQWLARPSVATGFAGVMAATLVGMMWWGQPMDEALPQRPAPAIASAPGATAPPVQAPPPIAPAQRAAPEPPRAALRKSAPAAEAKLDTAPITREAVPPAAQAPAPTPAPAAAAPAEHGITAATAGTAATAAFIEEAKRSRSLSEATDAAAAKAAPRRGLNDLRQQRFDAEAHPAVAQLRASIAAEPARWAWQRDGGAPQAMNDAVYAWLAQLDAAAGAAWQPRAARETAPPLGRELRLLRDGRVLHSLRLTERGVSWEREQAAWQAELPLATVQALEAAAP
jgi:hypothetical protein